MYWNHNNSPEKFTGIIIFIIFMLLMASLAILGNHSRAFAEDVNKNFFIPTVDHIQLEERKLIENISNAIYNNIILCRQKSDGTIIFHSFCRNDIYCLDSIKEYARYIVKYSLEFNIDPWLSTAVAMHETNFDAYTVGSKGEKSIFQLLPYSPWGKKLYFIKNPKYRKECKHQIGHCQEESVGAAIKFLSYSLKECKNISGALSMYNGGECYKSSTKKYIKGVKEKINILKTKHVSIQWCTGGKI